MGIFECKAWGVRNHIITGRIFPGTNSWDLFGSERGLRELFDVSGVSGILFMRLLGAIESTLMLLENISGKSFRERIFGTLLALNRGCGS